MQFSSCIGKHKDNGSRFEKLVVSTVYRHDTKLQCNARRYYPKGEYFKFWLYSHNPSRLTKEANMAEFIKVNGQEYPATLIYNYNDRNWDMRETQTIYLTMSHDAAAALLPSGTPWSIVFRETKDKLDNDGNPTG